MKVLSNKELIKILPSITKTQMNKTVTGLKFIGGGSFGNNRYPLDTIGYDEHLSHGR